MVQAGVSYLIVYAEEVIVDPNPLEATVTKGNYKSGDERQKMCSCCHASSQAYQILDASLSDRRSDTTTYSTCGPHSHNIN